MGRTVFPAVPSRLEAGDARIARAGDVDEQPLRERASLLRQAAGSSSSGQKQYQLESSSPSSSVRLLRRILEQRFLLRHPRIESVQQYFLRGRTAEGPREGHQGGQHGRANSTGRGGEGTADAAGTQAEIKFGEGHGILQGSGRDATAVPEREGGAEVGVEESEAVGIREGADRRNTERGGGTKGAVGKGRSRGGRGHRGVGDVALRREGTTIHCCCRRRKWERGREGYIEGGPDRAAGGHALGADAGVERGERRDRRLRLLPGPGVGEGEHFGRRVFEGG
mmetsp:Transcript_18141/g.39449  ORF Transcript_18141/g.39449 Transcript_18141/m.39449 type:complete len:281 (+) Transcript_18141:2-844(+)